MDIYKDKNKDKHPVKIYKYYARHYLLGIKKFKLMD